LTSSISKSWSFFYSLGGSELTRENIRKTVPNNLFNENSEGDKHMIETISDFKNIIENRKC